MAKKKIDLAAEIKKAEGTLMGARIIKLNQLVTAKEEHDKAVKQAHEDELNTYKDLIADFMKRVPYLSLLVEQLSKLAKLPEVTIQLADTKWVFSAHKYDDANRKPCFGIGAKQPPSTAYASTYYIVVGPNGEWVTHKDNTTHNMYCTNLVDNDNKYVRGHYPNSKEFMLAALEWEKTLLATVDAL